VLVARVAAEWAATGEPLCAPAPLLRAATAAAASAPRKARRDRFGGTSAMGSDRNASQQCPAVQSATDFYLGLLAYAVPKAAGI